MDESTFVSQVETGDLLLYHSTSWYSWLIEWVSGSEYSHIGLLLKDPIDISPELKGLYVLESSPVSLNPKDPKKHGSFGVQITPLKDVLDFYRDGKQGFLYYRKLETKRDSTFYETLVQTHRLVHGKRYDFTPRDWFRALLNIDIGNPESLNKFWSSS